MSAGVMQSKLPKGMQQITQKCKISSDLNILILSIPDLRALRASDIYCMYIYIYVHIYYTNAIPPRISK